MRTQRLILTTILMVLSSMRLLAQGYVDQEAVQPIIDNQLGSVDFVQPVGWKVYEYKEYNLNDGKTALQELQAHIDSLPGGQQGHRQAIVELANRARAYYFQKGRQVLLPDTFAADYRAYSPYPFHYAAADSLPKLFIIDKYTQTFGAYEYGKLVRWGILSTGSTDDKTPTGRYNFNWQAEYRLSNAAPPGETWELYWVFNFHARAGIHVHQYQLPIGMNVSHGCVRLIDADARWNYAWANGWVQEKGRLVRNGTPVMVINHAPAGRPAMWTIGADGSVRSLLRLPDDPMSLPAGTAAQRSAPWASGW